MRRSCVLAAAQAAAAKEADAAARQALRRVEAGGPWQRCAGVRGSAGQVQAGG